MNKAEVIKFFKSTGNAANHLGVTPGAISQWKTTIPEKQALKIERITGGKLKYDPEMYT